MNRAASKGGSLAYKNSNLKAKKLGEFELRFPSTWDYCGFEGQQIDSGIVLEANSDVAVKVTFRNTYESIPMVIPVAFSTTGNWAYITSMATSLTKTGCNLSFHNLESSRVTISVGYIAIG